MTTPRYGQRALSAQGGDAEPVGGRTHEEIVSDAQDNLARASRAPPVMPMSGRDLRTGQPRSLGSGLGVRCLNLGCHNRVVLGVWVERAPFRA